MGLCRGDLAALSRLLDEAMPSGDEDCATRVEQPGGEHQPLRTLARQLLEEDGQREEDEDDPLLQLPECAFRLADQRVAASTSPRAGDLVGPYRLIEPLGRGGMGVVWLAERESGRIKRKVALKLPFEGLQHHQLGERFERECAILEALEHRHIARLYDCGIAANGQRYLVLQRVAGVPITEYCDLARLTIRERVRLFLQVLQAVQYAHSRHVVHQDLKPSNILVTHEGEVQLLDFGIAMLLADDAAHSGSETQFAHSALTPDYASPEQFAGKSIGPASDIYSLGVLFYQLLTGWRPYRLPQGTRAVLEQAVLDAETVPPSRAVHGKPLASARGTTVRLLRRELQVELDAIAMKALEKNPCERYASAELFQRDLERWLACERVQAHPDSLAYRVRTFARRHRLALGAGVIAACALLLGGGSAAYQAQLAREQSLLARLQLEQAGAVQSLLVDLFTPADPLDADKQYEAALSTLGQVDALLEESPLERQKELLSIPRHIALNLVSEGRSAHARELLLQALPKVQAYFGEMSEEAVEYRSVIATTYALEGDHRQALAVYEELEPTLRALPAHDALAELASARTPSPAVASSQSRGHAPRPDGRSTWVAALQVRSPIPSRMGR